MGALTLIVAFITLFIVVSLRRRSTHKTRLPLPPGPKPLPIIGNVFDMPSVRPWEKYSEWSRTYGSDLIYLQTPIHPTIILGSFKAATDLLEKRSHLYSDRVRSVMAELMTWDFDMSLIPYGPKWRARRRMFHQHFHPGPVEAYRPVQLAHARAMLNWIFESPKYTPKHIRHVMTSIVFSVVYGERIPTMDHRYVVAARIATEGFNIGLTPGAFWVEYLPILKHIPNWFPGAGFKRLAQKYAPHVHASTVIPYDEVKNAMRAGNAPPSVARALVEEVEAKYGGTSEEHVYDEMAKDVAGVAYAAGVDTIATTTEFVLLAMSLFPAAQKQAQLQLDRIVGPSRLPDFGDLPNLPYIRAVVLETLRWLPNTPVGFPHAVMEDDVYEGYLIPKGTVVFPNAWRMTHNPEDYPDPDEFKPERHLAADGEISTTVRDPATIIFGFGRRVCPGRHFAMDTLFITVASILHVFNIEAGVDEFGKPVELNADVVDGFIIRARHVPCGLYPRSEAAVRVIREAATALDET